jgi:hypothetical protein
MQSGIDKKEKAGWAVFVLCIVSMVFVFILALFG